ncbi:MAG: hypothetical protein V7636_1639 [Actinomycetota bacterium]
MSASFNIQTPDSFTAGTVGPPGQRTFFVQVVDGVATVTLKLEKTQVAALAQYVAELLADLPPVDDSDVPIGLELADPVVAEWTVGTIGVAVDDTNDRLVISFQELLPQDLEPSEEEEEERLPDPDAGVATFLITRPQALGFVRRAAELVSSGRPPCPLCGRPLDPTGHVCIKTNGHLH